MVSRRCLRCMHALKMEETVCQACGQKYGDAKTEVFALKPGTILEGKYLVGEMLGQGGFGITYIGFDLLLEQKVAIKEYFPMSTGLVSRENQSTVVWSETMLQKSGMEKGFDSFLKEARKMAKLGGISGVVGVRSVFIQNETAYIVMDYVEGETLLEKLKREGPMEYTACVELLTPIIQALAKVHQHDIIHRDISPDNIMVQPDGQLILLDLGAAKDLQLQQKGSVQSSQLVAKHGFSPIEQYAKDGQIGPWTDVYAMAATIYYCCTGVMPASAVNRIVEDSLVCKAKLTKKQFDIIAKGMAVKVKDRPQDVNAFLKLLDLKQNEKKRIPTDTIVKGMAVKVKDPSQEVSAFLKRRDLKKNEKIRIPKALIVGVSVMGLLVALFAVQNGYLKNPLDNPGIPIMQESEAERTEIVPEEPLGEPEIPATQEGEAEETDPVTEETVGDPGVPITMETEEEQTEAMPEDPLGETLPDSVDSLGEGHFRVSRNGDVVELMGKELLIQTENGKHVTVTIGGLDIEDSYMTNQASSFHNACEYKWSISIYEENTYEVSTTSWAFNPGDEKETTVEEMQNSLWLKDSSGTGSVVQGVFVTMSHTKDSISWKFTMNDSCKFDLTKVTQIVTECTGDKQPKRLSRTYVP